MLVPLVLCAGDRQLFHQRTMKSFLLGFVFLCEADVGSSAAVQGARVDPVDRKRVHVASEDGP